MIILGKFTGEFVEECPEVQLADKRIVYPSPIFAPGVSSMLSKDEIEKYKGEVYAILVQVDAQYYVLGVSPLFKQYKDWGNYPDEKSFRTKSFLFHVNDTDESFIIEKRDGKSTVTINKDGIEIETEGKLELKVGNSKVTLVSGGNEIDIESPTLKLLGTTMLEVEEKNAVPSGTGALCAIPTCVFSGAIHVGNKAM